jgi:hypothetical protein
VAASKPLPITPASHGAARKIAMLATVMTAIAPVSTVRPKPLASPSSARSCRRLVKIGTNGAVRPGRDEHVERDLGDAERGVVGIELGARSDTCSRRPGCARRPSTKYANDRTVRTTRRAAGPGRSRRADVATMAVMVRAAWGGATRSLGGGPRRECAPSGGGREFRGTAMPL